MGLNTTDLQKLYVAYYNRPADPAGLQYWQSGLDSGAIKLSDVASAFASSTEYTDTFAGKSHSEIINNIYINLFGHQADNAGLLYWVNLIDTGKITLAAAVTSISTSSLLPNADGSANTDGTVFSNKVAAATSFTNAVISTPGAIASYSGTAANVAAKAYI